MVTWLATAGEAPRATVILLTRDGGERLVAVVEAVLAQATPWPWELLVVDSGTRDGSLACLQGSRARVLHLPGEAFRHGATRNLAAAAARGQDLVFLVQDALPLGADWLHMLVQGLADYPDAAGGYARQLPRADADPALRERLARWTPPGTRPTLKRLPEPGYFYRLPPEERLLLAAFDNVCSIVSRARLLRSPFLDVPFGEDICWGKARLLDGEGLLYLPQVQVEHSHRRPFWEVYARTRVEHGLLQRELGLRGVTGPRALARGLLSVAREVPSGNLGGAARLLAELLGQAAAIPKRGG